MTLLFAASLFFFFFLYFDAGFRFVFRLIFISRHATRCAASLRCCLLSHADTLMPVDIFFADGAVTTPPLLRLIFPFPIRLISPRYALLALRFNTTAHSRYFRHTICCASARRRHAPLLLWLW